MMKRLGWIVGVSLIACVAAAQDEIPEGPCVTEVLDGATFVLRLKDGTLKTNRLEGVVAPAWGQPYARASRDHLKVVLGREDGAQVNVVGPEELLQDRLLEDGSVGVAETDESEAHPFFLRAQKRAQFFRRGLWATTNAVSPVLWLKTHKAQPSIANTPYASWNAATREIFPGGRSKPRQTDWLYYSKARGTTANGYVVALPCGDIRPENEFDYLDGTKDGSGLVRRRGMLVSVALEMSYAKEGSEPSESVCQQAVEKYFNRGSEIRTEILSPAGHTMPLKAILLNRYGADAAEPIYACSREGRLYVFLKNCGAKKPDASFGPATLQGSGASRGNRVLNLRHERNEKLWKTKYEREEYGP